MQRTRFGAAYSPILCLALVIFSEALLSYGQGSADLTRLRKPLAVTPSTLSCNITDPKRSMCMMHNAYYWKKTIYFVTEDPSVRLFIPEFQLPYFQNMPTGWLKTTTPQDMARMLTSSKLSTMYNFKQGILFYRIYPENYYHHTWEIVANVHVLACKMFGKCEYDPNENELQVLYFDGYKVAQLPMPHAKLLKCITGLEYEEMYQPRFTLPARFEQLTVGLGSEAFGQGNVVWKRSPPSMAIREAWHRRMRSCMHLPASPLPSVGQMPAPPVVSIVQRLRGVSGRSISNVEQVVEWVQKSMPGCKVQVVHMDNKTMLEQVSVWGNSTMVISTHGAQLTNSLYMPNNSVLLEIDQWTARAHPFFRRYVVNATYPFLNVSHFHVMPRNESSMFASRPADLKKHNTFAAYKPEQQKQWLERPSCSYSWIRSATQCTSIWVKYYTDIVVEQPVLEAVLEKAKKWLSEQGVQVGGELVPAIAPAKDGS